MALASYPLDLLFAALVIGFGLTLLLFFHISLRRTYLESADVEQWPSVTIVVPVKNGLPHVVKLVARLLQQKYEGDYTILVGDDSSTDGTYEVLKAQYDGNPRVRIRRISKQVPGKQGVLIELLKRVETPYFLITDADMLPSRGWLRAMVSLALATRADMICSPSVAVGRSFLTYLQRFEWALGSIFAMTMEKIGLPVTGIGNNMLVKTEAYRKLGGYEALRPSLIEDYLLYMEMHKRKMHVRWYFAPYSVNYTRAEEKIRSLFEQRLRWFYGGLKEKLPIYTSFFALFQLLYPLAFLYLLISVPSFALLVIGLWIGLEFSLYLRFARLAKLRKGIFTFEKYLCFFLFQWLFTYASVTYNLLHRRVLWRGATLSIDPNALPGNG